MKRIKIGTRVHLNYIKFTKSKNDRISVYFRDNLSGENASKNAMLFPVLLSGSEKYPDMVAISQKLQGLYGANLFSSNSKNGTEHVTGMTLTFLSSKYTLDGEDNLSDCIKLLSEILLHPTLENGIFRSDYVDIEKNNLISDIRAEINDKGVYAKNRLIEMLCGDDEYKTDVNGTEETAGAVTPQSLYDNYLRLINSAPVEVFYAGEEPIERVVETFKLYFNSFKGEAAEIKATTLIEKKGEIYKLSETMEISQGKLAIGFVTDIEKKSPLAYAMALFSAMYGVVPTSKLFMNVREKLSLCYSCSSRYIAAKGIMLVLAGIDTDKKEVAQAEILRQLEEMLNGNFTDEELEIAKRSIVNAAESTLDSAGSLISWWLTRICEGRMYSPEQAVQSYLSVTREDIVNAGKSISLEAIFFLAGNGKEVQK